MDREAPVVSKRAFMRAGHGAALLDMLHAAMGEADVSPRDVTHIVVTRGPGTFTGSRIGVAAARALALATGAKVVPVTSLWAIFANHGLADGRYADALYDDCELGGDIDAPGEGTIQPVVPGGTCANLTVVALPAKRGRFDLQLFGQDAGRFGERDQRAFDDPSSLTPAELVQALETYKVADEHNDGTQTVCLLGPGAYDLYTALQSALDDVGCQQIRLQPNQARADVANPP
ncbi:MAG: tRNA (adenosine(37)-N6)-threonylcarbamoyltransferase complex dimerization subunit type 1 TsaB, partial [Pseudomonadota bacterium]